MKYFLIGTDEKNRIPYNINKNRVVDVRTLTREGIGTLPMWNIIGMDLPDEGFFPDLICSPFVLMSKNCIKTAAMYQPDIIYRGVKLWDKGSGVNRTSYLSILEELDCMSGQTQFNTAGNRITRLVLDRDRIGGNAVFRIKGYNRGCIAGRLDFVESLLRRGIEGITLEEAALA